MSKLIGKLLHGPFIPLRAESIPLTESESYRLSLVVDDMELRNRQPWKNADFQNAVVDAVKHEPSRELTILIRYGLAQRSEAVYNAYEWKGSNLYMIHDAWRALKRPPGNAPMRFHTFANNFIDVDTGERISKEKASHIANKATERGRGRVFLDDVKQECFELLKAL